MTNMIEKSAEIAARIQDIAGVESANVWTKVAGKERIYIELMRADSDGKRYGGQGAKIYLDLNTGKVVSGRDGYNRSPYINSFTKRYHEDADTLAKIEAAIEEGPEEISVGAKVKIIDGTYAGRTAIVRAAYTRRTMLDKAPTRRYDLHIEEAIVSVEDVPPIDAFFFADPGSDRITLSEGSLNFVTSDRFEVLA